ncbi:hypothetical protein GUITHDRAFT_141441 [Guillardia theta CCMP2712]|uniref:SANT and BTB domain-containing protein n=1 Tax=Guillardia theta (strain CCMP2712) TaxID=905079 RepID=L1J2C4_GUITC|nr:hypothetical protein GUITHDRAFT_141441 [Guillardia theta CCMP2712]EKX42245.1 hypothetical protein GUITHDRAFT_141441 [Guillardia theta CCMP2712]|eukprot:XP_005829225.1 hypothetical protein GUITHDRAFT_141441 [Guillardia theta CCMP2712]
MAKWEELARTTFPGYSAKILQQRWFEIKDRPGLEYKLYGGYKGQAMGSPDSHSCSRGGYGGRTFNRSEKANNAPPLPSATGTTIAGGTVNRRPASASAVRISATRQSAVGQLRGATLASSHAPVLAFSKVQDKGKSSSASREADKNQDQSSSQGQGTAGNAANKNVRGAECEELIVIHVCDENRGINKDFTCRKDVLLSEMAYFQSYLNGSEASDDIDISVHCDIQIFQWLIKYLNEPNSPPPLDSMTSLCHDMIPDGSAATNLSAYLTPEELEDLNDRRDKLLSRLYMKKIEALFQSDDNMISRCAFCGKLFALKNRSKMACSKAKIFIDFNGSVIAEHAPVPNWDVNKYLLSLRARKLSWREIYWKIWGMIATMRCKVCGNYFTASELEHCAFCPQQPLFRPGQNMGMYPCCNTPAIRFDTSNFTKTRRGCCAKSHVIDEENAEDASTLTQLMKRHALVCVPFEDANKENLVFSSDDEDGGEEDIQEDEALSGTCDLAIPQYEDSASDGERDIARQRVQRMRVNNAHQGIQRKRKVTKRSEGRNMSGSRPAGSADQNQWKQEMWREEDARRLAGCQTSFSLPISADVIDGSTAIEQATDTTSDSSLSEAKYRGGGICVNSG